ncbi:MAG: sensor domain-containing diguanylate cyclase [Tissierellia bacterium]|nr:sensor domain-containing diguanylate cyclase [Tissierellia bacterium]MDD4780082.1 sensor domain-containing diguanylate cyclase [Tissierellia bacterium]
MDKKDKVIIATMLFILSIFIGIFYLYSIDKIGKIYQDETKETIMNIKKSFLKNTVDNLIFEIEIDRKNETELYKKHIDRRYDTLNMEDNINDEEFVNYFINRFTLDFNKDPYIDYWTVFLWNNKSNQILYDPENIVGSDVNSTVEKIKFMMSHYKLINRGEISGFIGVSQEFIDNRIKAITADKIRKLKFDNNSYIWVNEIINYDGGKDYAIRRVHPNLPETEGMLLSTEIKDIKGNLPYLEELEGVKKNGEIFLKYYFKELGSEIISEKLSFLKLYKDFDWIIGMGVHIDDIQQYIINTNVKSTEITRKYILLFLLILLTIIFFSISILMLLKNWFFKIEKRKMEQENNVDILTFAYNRKYGTNEMNKSFNEFKKKGTNSAIMMFDIDNFKSTNDTFGHEVGDQILKEVVNIIYKNIRNTDRLIRWGGDEFICICYGLNKENVLAFGEKLCSSVASLKISSGNATISTTISIGFSYFEENDKDIGDVIQRADMAMYKSKAEGRNTVNLL